VKHLSKFQAFYQIFIKPTKIWRIPKKSEILIYDACGAENFSPYLSEYDVEIIHVRNELVNLPCLLFSILTWDFWRGRRQAYTDTYIRLVAPKIILTFIDNSIAFYTISERFPNIMTMFFQNGTRSELGDVFDHLIKSDHYHVDYMLVHGNAIGTYYQKFISGQIYVAGSLINNQIKKNNGISDGSVLFISQYRVHQKDNEPIWISSGGVKILWNQFYAIDILVLNYLNKYCIRNNKLLRICGMESIEDRNEKDFYSNILTEAYWEYMPRYDRYNSYKLLDLAEIVITIDSTLGYESFARGNKTAFFSCRGNYTYTNSKKFGWPAGLPENGPFWTNEPKEEEFCRVMDYLLTVSAEDWENTRQNYAGEIMEFDSGNTRFIELLDQILS